MAASSPRDVWVAKSLGADPSRYPLAGGQHLESGVEQVSDAPGGGHDAPPAAAPPPPARAHMSRKELDAWQKAHPKRKLHEIGPGLPDITRQKYTAKNLRGWGFVMAGAMNIGGGGTIEYWISDRGDGEQYDVTRDPMWPNTQQPAEEPPNKDEQREAEDDLTEAKQRVEELRQEKQDLLTRMRDVLKMPRGPAFELAAKKYVEAEKEWLEHVGQGSSRIADLAKDAQTEAAAGALRDEQAKIWNLYNGYPASDEWEGRYDIPGERP